MLQPCGSVYYSMLCLYLTMCRWLILSTVSSVSLSVTVLTLPLLQVFSISRGTVLFFRLCFVQLYVLWHVPTSLSACKFCHCLWNWQSGICFTADSSNTINADTLVTDDKLTRWHLIIPLDTQPKPEAEATKGPFRVNRFWLIHLLTRSQSDWAAVCCFQDKTKKAEIPDNKHKLKSLDYCTNNMQKYRAWRTTNVLLSKCVWSKWK